MKTFHQLKLKHFKLGVRVKVPSAGTYRFFIYNFTKFTGTNLWLH